MSKPPKLSKNGVPLGRKPDIEAQARKAAEKKFDEMAFAAMVPDLAKGARAALGVGTGTELELVMDGATFHWAPEAMKALRDHNLIGVEGYPATSPELNPPENVFGFSKKPMDRMQHTKPAEDAAETLRRFRELVKTDTMRKRLRNTVDGLAGPDGRIKRVIAADGGPIQG